MLFDNLKDIIKHTKPFFTSVKLKNIEDVTHVEAMEDNQTIMLYGKLNNTITEIDTCIGFTRLSIIDGMLNFPPFNDKAASTTFTSEVRNNASVLSEINFVSPNGHNSTYRFMPSSTAETKIQVPPFRGVKWDVQWTPTQQNIKDLSYFNGVLGSNEPIVRVSVKNKKIVFHIGSAGSDRTSVTVGDTSGTMSHEWSWTLSQVLSLLKLGENEKCTVYFSDQGAMKIELVSGMASYEYILPPMRS